MALIKAVFLALISSTLAAASEPKEAVRLAVLTESPQPLLVSDLLTAELTSQKSFTLFERDEVAKIRNEQARVLAAGDHLKIGHLLGADGLLLVQLNQLQNKTNSNLSLRLLAVGSGVVLCDWEFGWPVSEPGQWARETAVHLSAFLPKLRVQGKDAIPISIVNFRSAVQTREAVETERQLRLLTTHLLSQEPRLFVLERERMPLLSQEKEFKGDDSAFWSGSFLLDASIDPLGYTPRRIVVQARLTPAAGGLLRAIEVSGNRTNLLELAHALTAQVKQALNVHSMKDASATQEAATFFSEAQWAFKWRLFREAVAAAESAWALGQQTREVAELRIRACRELATPDWGDSAYVRPTAQNSAPDVAKLEPANLALQYFRQGFQTFLARENKADLAWYHLGLDVLSSTSDLLRQFYVVPESRTGHEEQLAELRLLAREVGGDLQEHPAYGNLTNLTGRSNSLMVRSGNETSWRYWSGTKDLPNVMAAKGAYWYDTPDAALKVFRDYAQSGQLHRVRRYLVYRQLIGWTPEEQKRAPTLWREFIQELCNSTNALLKVEGTFMAYAEARDNPQQEEAARRTLYAVSVENARLLDASGLAQQFLQDVTDMLPHYGDREASKLEMAFRSDYKTAIEFGKPAGKMEAQKNYLTNNTQFEYPRFAKLFIRGDYDETQAAELLPLVKDYQARLLKGQFETPPSYVGDWGTATNAVDGVRRTLERWVTAPTFKPAPTQTNSLPATVPSTALARLWVLPYSLLQDDSDYPPLLISHSVYRQGRWWMEVEHGKPVHNVLIFSVDLHDFHFESFDVPLDKLGPYGGLEVLGDYVYLSKADALNRYSLKTKTWELLPVPLEGKVAFTGTHASHVPVPVRMSVVGGRLFISTLDSIMELAENGQSVRVLAGTRRRPAISTLDSLESYSLVAYLREPTPIFQGPGESLRAFIREKIYTCDPNKQEWSETMSLPASPNTPSFWTFDNGSIYRQVTGERKTYYWLVPANGSSPELLLADSASPQKPRWVLPQNFSAARSLFALAQDTLWVLAGELNLEAESPGPAALAPQDGSNLALLKYETGVAEPQVTFLRFELKEGSYFTKLVPKLLNAGKGGQYVTPQGHRNRESLGPTVFESTEQGFIISGDYVPGFWFLPRNPSQTVPEGLPAVQDETNRFFAAVAAGNLVRVKQYLEQGMPVDARNDHGLTALMVAAISNRLEVAKFLVQQGAEVNTRSTVKSGNTVLCFAVEGNQPELIEMLLAHGADLNARSGANEGTALGYAAWGGRTKAAEVLLNHGVDVNEPVILSQFGHRYTPLMIAARANHEDLVELLLARGARLDARNNFGATALMEAAKMPAAACVRLLLAKGADPNFKDPSGHTGLILAAYNGRSENVKVLLASGADPNVKAMAEDDFDGRPYDAAEAATMRHFPETAAIIREAQKRLAAQGQKP